MWKRLLSIAGALVILGGVIGGVLAYDAKIAKKEDVTAIQEQQKIQQEQQQHQQLLNQQFQMQQTQIQQQIQTFDRKFDKYAINQVIRDLKDRIWEMEKDWGGDGVPNAPEEVKEVYHGLVLDLESAEADRDELITLPGSITPMEGGNHE